MRAEMEREIDRDAVAALDAAGDAEPGYGEIDARRRISGRGAVSNPAVRFFAESTSPFDDGWDTLNEAFEAPLPPDTTLIRDTTKSAISWNNSPDLGFDRAVNPYRGCEHGCIYCYARPTHAYLGYSPGLDFETKLIFKPGVAECLEKELRKSDYVPQVMALGSNTDPYQPVERTLKLTRAVLEVLDRFNHPVGIVTKSAGVLRDLDILSDMAKRNLVRVHMSITTLDARLARVMEPRAASPARRLQAVQALHEAGVPVGVLAAPMIPAINDAELEKILKAASAAGARHASYILLRLPLELRTMFEDWLQANFPDRAGHILSLIRQTRAGALNDPRFHHRFSGHGPYADLLRVRFNKAIRDYGLNEARSKLDCSKFAVPQDAVAAAHAAQMSLF
jgi:DNA repair photolyase